MAGVGLDTNLRRSEQGPTATLPVGAATSSKKITTEARSLPIDEVKLSAGAKAMLKQAKDGEEAVRLFSSILSKGKNGKSNWYDSLLWGKGVKNTEQTTVSSEDQNKVDSAEEEAKKREEYLNPPYDMKTGARKDHIPGSPVTQQELDQLYKDNWDSYMALADGMHDEERKAKFLTALNNRTLNIQHAEDVQGLNFRLNEERYWNNGIGGGMRQSLSHTPIRDDGNYLIGWSPDFGGTYITWD